MHPITNSICQESVQHREELLNFLLILLCWYSKDNIHEKAFLLIWIQIILVKGHECLPELCLQAIIDNCLQNNFPCSRLRSGKTTTHEIVSTGHQHQQYLKINWYMTSLECFYQNSKIKANFTGTYIHHYHTMKVFFRKEHSFKYLLMLWKNISHRLVEKNHIW